MAGVTVESLNFKLILDDQEFNDEITEMTEKANTFNKTMSEMLGEKGGKSASGLAKRISELGDLRREIKETVEGISMLQQRMERLYQNSGANGGNLFLMGDTQNKIDALNAKLETLSQRERELAGDGGVAAALDNITESIHEQSIESLQLAEALRRQAEETERLDRVEKAQKKADQSAKIKAEKEARRQLVEQKKKELEWQKKIDAQFAVSNNALKKAKTNVDAFRNSQAALNIQLDRGSRLMRGLTSLAATYFSVAGAGRLIRNLVEVTGEFEMQRTTLRAILKDIDGADAIFARIKELAVISPFTFKELVTYTKQLSAFSVPMNELYDTTKMLADVSAGLGVGMDRLILAYGQIRSAGVLRGQELRQLTEAGIPVLNELKQKFKDLGETAISTSDIFDKISTRQVPFEMIAEIFRDMTSEGGKFYKMQEVQAETLKGKLSNLTDAYQIMFAEIGERINPALKQGVDWLRSLAVNYEKVGRIIGNLILVYGAYRTALAAAHAMQKVTAFQVGMNAVIADATAAKESITKLAAAFRVLTSAKAGAGAAAAATGFASIAAAASLALVAVVALIRKIREKDIVTKGLEKTEKVYAETLATETAELEVLFNKLNHAEQGTREYESAKKQILSTYDKYLTDLDRENLALGKQAEVYENLTAKLRENAAMKAYTEGMEGISKDYINQQDNIIENLVDAIGKAGLKEDFSAVAKQMTQLVRREIVEEDMSSAAKEYLKNWREALKKQVGNSGMVSSIPNVDSAIQKYQGITDQMREASSALADSVNIMYGVDFSQQVEKLEGWKGAVEDLIKDYGTLGSQLSAKDFSTREEYIDSLVKKYNEANETLRKFGKTENAETKAAKELIPMITSITDSMGVNLQTWQRGVGGGGGGSKGADPMIGIIDKRIKALQDLEEMYDDLSKYVSDDFIKTNFGGLFAEGFNFDDLIKAALDEMKTLGEEGKKRAKEIEDRLAFDEASRKLHELVDFHKRIEGYVKSQRAVEEQIADLNAQKEIDLAKLAKGTKEYAATEKYYTEEIEKLKEQLLELNSIQMTDLWRELTGPTEDYSYKRLTKLYDRLLELDEILKAIEPIRSDKGLVIGYQIKKSDVQSEELAEMLGLTDENGVLSLTIGQFQQLVKGIQDVTQTMRDSDPVRTFFKLLKDGTTDADQLRKAFVSAMGVLGTVVSGIGNIGGIITDIGNTTRNVMLRNFGETLEVVTEITDMLLENESVLNSIYNIFASDEKKVESIFSTTDAITLAVKGISFLVESVAKGIKKNYEFTKKAQEAAVEFRNALHQINLESANSIFGTNNAQKAAESIRNLKSQMEEFQNAQKQNILRNNYTAQFNQLFTNIAKLRGMSSSEWRKALDEWNTAMNSSYEDSQEYFEWLLANQELIADGMTKKQNQALDSLISSLKAYKDAMSEYEAMMGDVFGKIADSITDALVNAFIETGDAATDLADNMAKIFSDLGLDIAKSLIHDVVVSKVLNKYMDEAEGLFDMMSSPESNPDEIAAKLGDLTSKFTGEMDVAAQYANAVLTAFRNSGMDVGSASGTKDMSEGIKSITEDTANLLASYINAIRADVSVTRMVAATILGLLPSAPTLAEYLAEIQANTYNNAVAAQEILNRLDSSMSAYPNGGRAFNVNIS